MNRSVSDQGWIRKHNREPGKVFKVGTFLEKYDNLQKFI